MSEIESSKPTMPDNVAVAAAAAVVGDQGACQAKGDKASEMPRPPGELKTPRPAKRTSKRVAMRCGQNSQSWPEVCCAREAEWM